MSSRADIVRAANHVVVKIGSAVLLRDERSLDRATFVALVADIAAIIDRGIRVTVVSSGAVALGRQRLPEERSASVDLPRLQALAALGQSRLIQMYDREFAEYGRQVAQILLGRADLDQRTSFLNARLTLDAVHRLGAIPVVNENDSVATDELRFGDNDELAAATCGLVQADLLIILSDVEGVLRREDGVLTDRVGAIAADDPDLDLFAGPSQSGFGRGGMLSKVAAARTAGRFGASTIIAPGKRGGVVTQILAGEDVGTLVTPGDGHVQGRKVWLGAGAMSAGSLVCDDGARRAVMERGASLLPSGIREVRGSFGAGAVVELVDAAQRTFARGIATYSAEDTRRIAGCNSEQITEILGFKVLDSVVHRDNLVLL